MSQYGKEYEKTPQRIAYSQSERRKQLHRDSSNRFHKTQKRQEYIAKYNAENKDKQRDYKRAYVFNRRNSDGLFRFKTTLRCNICGAFKNTNNRKTSKTTEILGCSMSEFKNYIESKFEHWMNWENFGKKKDINGRCWELDHIIPLCSAKTKEDIIMLNHYTNFQPLCYKINRGIKGGNYEPKPSPSSF